MDKIKDNFQEKGFVVVKSLVSKKMIFTVFQQVEQLIDEALQIKKVNPSEFENVDTKYMFLKKNYPKIKSHIYDLIKYLDGVHAISTMPSLLKIIKELSGPSLLLDGIQLGINDFDNDNLIPFHQEMNNSFSYQCVTAWIPLIDLTVKKGTLAFVPKSHKNGYVKHTQINGYPAIVENIDSSNLKKIVEDNGENKSKEKKSKSNKFFFWSNENKKEDTPDTGELVKEYFKKNKVQPNDKIEIGTNYKTKKWDLRQEVIDEELEKSKKIKKKS